MKTDHEMERKDHMMIDFIHAANELTWPGAFAIGCISFSLCIIFVIGLMTYST